MRITLIFICLFSSSFAFANFKSRICPNIRAENFAHIFLEESVTCETVEKILHVLDEVKTFAGKEMPFDLFVQSKSQNSFNTFGRIVVLNQQQVAWGGVRSQDQNEKIWAHEIGHTFFSSWLAKDFKGISGFHDYIIASTDIQVQKTNPNFDTSQALAAKWKPEYAKARDLQAPYNELFADLVGVLYANDTVAMTSAMVAPGMTAMARAEANYYGFTGKYELSKWNQSEVHFYFAPVRAYIGEHFLKFPMTNDQKANVLKNLYQACLKEIQDYWAKNISPNPAEANKNLIRVLGSQK